MISRLFATFFVSLMLSSLAVSDHIIIIHGLNLKPSKMAPIADYFQKIGITPHLISLQDHIAGNSMRCAELAPIWKSAIDNEYKKVSALVKAQGEELHLLGFSLGGLLIQFIKRDLPGKDILLAPALSLTFSASVASPLTKLPLCIDIPSRSPEEYRAFSGTTLYQYRALFDLLRELPSQKEEMRKRKTLILMSKDDPLVSFEGVEELIKEFQLPNWNLHVIKKNNPKIAKDIPHLIIDEESLGKTTWQDMLLEFELLIHN